jgi:tripartite-type tricarboxylate transporter receptor subunit TctC
MSRVARAQVYPTRPVRIIVGWAAGGASDIAARLIGQWLSERLGQQFIIENRQGADGGIATESVVRAPPDGYTLLLADASATYFEKSNYNLIPDIAPIAVRARLADLGQDIFSRDQRTPEALAVYQKSEIEKWWPIIKAANIKAE